MPVQLSPPYGITQPRTLYRWLDVNSQNGSLRRTGTYFKIPSFLLDSAPWFGYSKIVGQFDYVAPNNFSIKTLPDFSGLNCLVCIAYYDRVGNYVRYALNSNVGEILFFEVSLYDGQRISKNFRIEIWDTSNGYATAEESDPIYTSVLNKIDYRFGEDTALCAAGDVNEDLYQDLVNNQFPVPIVLDTFTDGQIISAIGAGGDAMFGAGGEILEPASN